jgi:hypothetical protein
MQIDDIDETKARNKQEIKEERRKQEQETRGHYFL